jgi:hypothetical protein
MDTFGHSTTEDPPHRAVDVTEIHNASVDEDAARQGGCAQVHLPTGAMCTLRHGHPRTCQFSPASQADEVLAKHKAAEHW